MALFGKKKDDKKVDTPKNETPKVEKEEKASVAPAPEKKVVAKKTSVSSSEGVLLRPRITEKATDVTEGGVYVFDVLQSANKADIADAIQSVYNVSPRKVNVVRQRPMKFMSRMRGRKGMRSGYKKAYVYLKKGDRIDII